MVDKFVELLLKMPIFNCTVAYPVVEGAVVPCSGTLWIRRKQSRTLQLGLVQDRVEDLVDGGLERGEADVNVIDLNEILGRTRLRSLLEAILIQI